MAALFLLFFLGAQPVSAQVTRVGQSSASTGGSGGTSLGVTPPAGTTLNDVMLAVVTVRGSGQTVNVPAGWTQVPGLSSSVGADLNQRVFYRVATALEPSHTFSWTVSDRGAVGMVVYRGVDTTAPINASGAQTATSSTNIVAPSITTTVADTMLVGFFGDAHNGATFTEPAGMTNIFGSGLEPSSGSGPNGTRTLVADETRAAVGATGTRTAVSNRSVDNIGHILALRPFVVVSLPGLFNAFETSTAPNPGATTGQIYTKLVSTNFSLDVVAVLAGAQLATFTNTVAVDLVTGSTGGANCPGTPAAIAGTSQNVNLTNGRGTTAAFNVAAAFPDVRVRMRYPVASPTVTSCSSDNFTIRPQSFAVTSSNANNTGTGAGTTIKTSANFNLTATAVAGYNGTPVIDNSLVVGTPNAGTIGGSFGAAPAGTGIAAGNSFFYSEVGNVGLNTDAVRDTAFTGVDQGPGDCVTSSTSNVLSGGRYGCWIGSVAVAQTTGVSGFGRFIPDNFNVSYGAPVFATACSGFSYVGQVFNYLTVPVLTVTARNGTSNGLTNATTTNYAGSYLKFTNASLAQAPYATQAARYTRFDAGSTPALDVSGLPGTGADPVISAFTNGVGTFTFAAGTGFSFTRSSATPSNPFDADIALTLNVIDSDGVTLAANPAAFGSAAAGSGIPFSDSNPATTNDKLMRYGRLRLGNTSGSQLLPLRVPYETQYWDASGFFVTNVADTCTALVTGNVGLGNYVGGGSTTVSAVSALSSGRGTITLAAPTGTVRSVDVAVNLGPVPPGTAMADACPAAPSAFAPAATAANLSYLRGNWCAPPGTYTKDPAARARFGIQGSDERIYMRENY